MNDTDNTNLQQGDERGYEAMGQAAQASVLQLLKPFKDAADAKTLLDSMSVEEFFQKFLIYADKFADCCCENYAKIIRQCSIVSEVRGTPTLALAKAIRGETFEPLDSILADYILSLKQLGWDFSAVSAVLHGSSVVDAALKGAAIGQLAGGFGSSGKTLGTWNALLQAGAEAERKLALLQQRDALLKQAEGAVVPKILEYLERVKSLPESLLDFGCAKCFGGQISFEHQRAALAQVVAAITPELENAITVARELPQAQKRLEEQRIAEFKASELAKKEQRKQDLKKPKPLDGIFYFVVTIALSCAAFYCFYDSPPGDDGQIFGAILTLGAFCTMILCGRRFTDRRPKNAKK